MGMGPITITNLHTCKECGALVVGGEDFCDSSALHAAWHALLERRIETAARTYTPPPTYR